MTRVGALLVAIALVLGGAFDALAEERTLAVITHPSRAVSLSSYDLRRFFLKQRRFWPDGSPVIAVNQTAATTGRTAFERLVFGRKATGLPAYWNQRYFEGLFPPITLDSDEAVQRYVAAKPNAVGYVDTRSVNGSVHVALRLADRDAPRP